MNKRVNKRVIIGTALLAIVFTLLAATSAPKKTSDYPNKSVVPDDFLLLLAETDVTNWYATFGQIRAQLALATNQLRIVKQPFYTNYTATVLDDVLMSYGTSQVVTLPDVTNAATPVGLQLTVTSTNEHGIFVITNANGVQLMHSNMISFTNTGVGSVTFVNSGAHWWMVGRSQ